MSKRQWDPVLILSFGKQIKNEITLDVYKRQEWILYGCWKRTANSSDEGDFGWVNACLLYTSKYFFDKTIYENRVFDSKGVADPDVEIQFGPNIKD